MIISVPEFYLLPFYAILRSIPSKLGGVIVMLAAILILLVLPFTDFSIIRGNTFKAISKFIYWLFICNFILLGILGAQHIEAPYVLMAQLATIFYFSYFVIILPAVSVLENILFYLAIRK